MAGNVSPRLNQLALVAPVGPLSSMVLGGGTPRYMVTVLSPASSPLCAASDG